MKQKGFAHLLLLIILIAGLAAGVYLTTSGNPLKLFSKAAAPKPSDVSDYVRMMPFISGNNTQAIPSKKPIYSYSISGNVKLKSSSSFVRAVLIDSDDNEYLVYESYPLISESNNFSINNACEETCYLKGIVPKSLRIEGNSSSLDITNVFLTDKLPLTLSVQDIPGKVSALKAEKDNSRIQKLASAATQKKISWTAGETSVSKKTYAQKRKLLPGLNGTKLDHLPNLQGFEYYKGGIFEVPSGGGGGGCDGSDTGVGFVVKPKSVNLAVKPGCQVPISLTLPH